MDTEDQQRLMAVNGMTTTGESIAKTPAAALGAPVHDERVRSIVSELGNLIEGTAVKAFIPQASKVYEGVAMAVKEGHLIQQTGEKSVTLHRIDSLLHDNKSFELLADSVLNKKNMVIDYDHNKVPTINQKTQDLTQQVSHAKDRNGINRGRGYENEGM